MIFEDVFNFTHMLESARQCCKDVRWKTSVQNFEQTILSNVFNIRQQLLKGTYRSRGFHEFIIRERGHERLIKSVHITERMVQKCLCDNCLLPIYTPKFIYDNGACLKGKGTNFAITRLERHIHNYWLENQTNQGYILLFDIKSFFNSINHDKLIAMVSKQIKDDKIFNLYEYLVRCFGNNTGLGLGSQISQVSASIYLNKLDHTIKDELRMKYYGRYMDDGYIICRSKVQLKQVLQKIIKVLEDLDLKLNIKKTHIISLTHPFTFLKRRFQLYVNGKLVKKPYKKNIIRYKRKYKKLVKKQTDILVINTLTKTFKGYLKEFNYYDRYTPKLLTG